MTRTGVSYFGVRIPRHARRDLEDIAGRGYTAVLHTFSENDLAYYRGTMAEIVAASHELGLEVQMCPWGVGRTFGGEAESRWVTFHPDACQVLDDGRRVATGCLNNPVYRAFCKEWADAAVEAGTDYVFWDEPHWTVPEHVGVDDPERWACCCDVCRELSGLDLAAGLTPEVQAFRERSVVEFLGEMLAHVAARGAKNTICLLPLTDGPHGVSDWDTVASLPHLSVLATDPYWKNFDESAESFVGRFARLLGETAADHDVDPQMWLPSFGLTREEIPELESAIAATRAAGIDDVWTWGYEACGHMTKLATPDAPLVWEAVSAALAPRPRTTEAARSDFADLDLRSTRDLVRLLNEADATVPDAVAAAGDALAAAIDAIVERLRRGGRLIYVGAGTSGALAALDAAECGATFGSPAGEVVAVVADRDADEDDRAAATNALLELALRPEDCVVAVSASGSTPFVLAALEAARERGALSVAVAGARDSRAAALADHNVAVAVGPEVVAGSTRLKGGTAQKLVVNTISTVTMIRLGRTYGGLMIAVTPGNEKLRQRARRNVVLASGAPEERVDEALEAAAGDARVALVSLLAGVDATAARERLETSGGSVRKAAEE